MPTAICPVCSATNIEPLLHINAVPVHCNLLWPSYTEAVNAPKGDIDLCFCRQCGHVFNRAFDSALMAYTQAYENSLHFSARFQTFIEDLVVDLVDRYDLHHKQILEIGAGQGDFLKLLCAAGPNTGIGFDPSYVPPQTPSENNPNVTIIQDFYTETYSQHQGDLLCCRHVLEHIEQPRPFLENVQRSLGANTNAILYFEVPNVLYTLRDMGIWDLIYEHCSYYSPLSLAILFQNGGFDILRLREVYQGQFLALEAQPAKHPSPFRTNIIDLAALNELSQAFAARYQEKLAEWQQQLSTFKAQGKKVVAWGSGSKGVTFLNVLRNHGQVETIIDINPRKQGMFVAGTGHEIHAPAFLQQTQPDVVLVMNPIYESEIQTTLRDLGVAAETRCV